ncbi:epoxide hydrolase [Methanosarcina sp.]|uniref:epoxide hydrolase family protein n=1 Tax=Methanosarcina sp. TaxID=2213 RepID=UPI002ABA11C5|nr:epoxide hydrolase [Methanosarcina sp.]MDY9926924.1 epoxide hydrolase [Methanosarcina sp.]
MVKKPFTINIPRRQLADLKYRLKATRWPDEVRGAGWDYGANLDYMKELVDYWQHKYDWRIEEKKLNRFDQFTAHIDGMDVHFVHEHGKGPNPTPIILTHGWPGSFYEFYKIIPLLTDPASHGGNPEQSFDVIVPSMPGFGFSTRPAEPGWDIGKTADLWHKLMTEVLGYKQYVASGTDWGSGVARLLGLKHPEVMGIYLFNFSYPDFTPDQYSLPNPTEAEQVYLKEMPGWIWTPEAAYAIVQSSRPQTLAYGLNDSPVGLAAWLLDKFRDLSDCDGNLEKRFSKDELITSVMIYWLTETANSAARTYYENTFETPVLASGERIEVPVGIGIFTKHIKVPREYAERSMNVQHWSEIPRGGHFGAMEEPELLAKDICTFFSTI